MAKAPTAVDRNFEAMLNRVEKDLQKRFIEAITFVANEADRAEIEDAISRNDAGAVFRALRLPPSYFEPLERAIDLAYYDGATREGQLINRASGDVMHIHFNGRHRRAEHFVRETGARLVAEVTNDVRESIRVITERGLAEGRNPRDVSLDIVGRIPPGEKQRKGGIIGLLAREAEWVANARRELETGDPNYFTRQARNRRGDASVKAAFDANKIPPEAVRNRLTADYADRLLVLRGERIARTEAIRALNAGRYEASRQLVENGDMPRTAVSYIWDATLSKRTRDSHLHLNGEEVGFDEYFRSPITGALLRFPGDTSLGAPGRETINCRCTMRTRIDRRQLATKKPRGRPVGSTNKPKAPQPPPQPVPPPVAPPTPPAVPVPRLDDWRQFTGYDDIREYGYLHNVASEKLEVATAAGSGASIAQSGRAVVTAAYIIHRFDLPPLRKLRGSTQSEIDAYDLHNANGWAYTDLAEIVIPPKTYQAQTQIDQFNSHIAMVEYRQMKFLQEYGAALASDKVSPEAHEAYRRFKSRDEKREWTVFVTKPDPEYGDRMDLVTKVMTHEFGHYFHDNYKERINNIIRRVHPMTGEPDWHSWKWLLSDYGSTKEVEFVAESFALYVTGDESTHYRIMPALLRLFKEADRGFTP